VQVGCRLFLDIDTESRKKGEIQVQVGALQHLKKKLYLEVLLATLGQHAKAEIIEFSM
jgi:hypothetical protein